MTTQVVTADLLHVFYFSTCSLVDEGGAETDKDVQEEEGVDDEIQRLEEEGLEAFWLKSDVEGNYEDVEGCQQHDKQIPLGLAGVIDA